MTGRGRRCGRRRASRSCLHLRRQIVLSADSRNLTRLHGSLCRLSVLWEIGLSIVSLIRLIVHGIIPMNWGFDGRERRKVMPQNDLD